MLLGLERREGGGGGEGGTFLLFVLHIAPAKGLHNFIKNAPDSKQVTLLFFESKGNANKGY